MRITPLHLFIITISLFIFSNCKTAKLADAQAAFDRGEYSKAADIYKKVYSKASPSKQRMLRGEVSYQMGICYEKVNIPARATNAFLNALRYNYPDSLIHLSIARNKHKEGKFKEAIRHYDEALLDFPDNKEAKSGLQGAKLALEWKELASRYKIKSENLFNLGRSDFSPMITGENNEFIYISSANDKAQGKKSDITGLKRSDIYVSSKDEKGQWIRPKALEGSINTEFDEGTTSFSPDGNIMYYTVARHNPEFATSTEIFTSTRSGGKWSDPKKLEISKDTISLYAHPAADLEGKYLYFVSDMPGGYGGKDIWRASIDGTTVLTIENLGDRVNTPQDEMFPTIHPSGDLLFSSNGHKGMGGLDIFRARQDEWGIWSIANLQHPLNSNADDFGMTFSHFNTPDMQEAGYFSSNRSDVRGWDHIYSFSLPSIKINITGFVVNQDQVLLPGAIVRVVGKDGSNQKTITKDDGSFNLSIDRGTQYVMMAGAKGYLNDKEEFQSDSDEADATYQVIFKLASLTQPVLIDNILYDFDEASLRPESAEALDELVELLNDNPHVTIELAAHTDRKGTEEYNIDLSQRRAESVINYLIEKGIDPARLSPKGYGKSSPKVVSEYIAKQHPEFLQAGQILNEEFIQSLNAEQKEIADQINRRTEFQVLETTFLIE